MKLVELIENKRRKGYIQPIAESLVGQEIIISAISKSSFVDQLALKGGVVMYNISKDARRASRDIDFDFIRYDISKDDSIDAFIKLLDKKCKEYTIKRSGDIEKLHQEDYEGKRTYVEISDSSYRLKVKLDIGVHTLFVFEQQSMEFFVSHNNEGIIVKVNPIEQIIAEKLYSLAKLGVASERYRDIYDIYFLLDKPYDKALIRQGLELLIRFGKNHMNSLEDLFDNLDDVFNSKLWRKGLSSSKSDWLNVNNDDEVIKKIEALLNVL